MKVSWLGHVKYEDALALQNDLVARKIASAAAPDEILLLEHEPVFTIGRTPDQSSLRDANALPARCVVINRGGQATWHGPGQLVGYPIIDLRRRGSDLHRYLRDLENLLIATCEHFGVRAARRDGSTGVWVEDRKIASIGVGVKRWISMHGFALNVCGDLEGFDHITPCGIAGVRMSSLEREGVSRVGVQDVAKVAGELFSRAFTAQLSGSDVSHGVTG